MISNNHILTEITMDYYHDNLDSLTLTQVRQGNAIELLPSGGSSYIRRWQLLDEAQHSIHIATFSVMRDDTTAKLEKILHAKLKQGVIVRIILDEIVNRTTFAGKFIKRLRRAGAQVHAYNGLFDEWLPLPKSKPIKHLVRNAKLKLKRHFHEKYMVIDGTQAILGGINWGDKYAYGGIKPFAWRDSDVYLSGPIVADLQMQFIKDFQRYEAWLQRKDSKALYYEFMPQYEALTLEQSHTQYADLFPKLEQQGTVPIRYVAHKPYDDNELKLTHAFLSLIANAKESIYWGCHGIRPPKIYGEYLAAAVKRGVKVHLITNSQHSAQSLMMKGLLGWMYKECRKYYRTLLNDGIRIYEWQLEGAFHSKNFLVDDKVASIGSYNLARGSTYHHSESNIFVYDDHFAQQVKAQFELDFKDCKVIDLKKIAKELPKENAFDRPLHERDLMIQQDMLPDTIKQELASKNYTRILT